MFENKLFKFFLSGCHSSEFSNFCLKLYLGYCRFVREHWLFNSFPNFLLVIYFFLNSDIQSFVALYLFPRSSIPFPRNLFLNFDRFIIFFLCLIINKIFIQDGRFSIYIFTKSLTALTAFQIFY